MHLYLHIPFCKQACHYCDFHFSTSQQYKGELVSAMAREISLRADYLPTRHLETIYFGGGTPSLLTEAELGELFEIIHREFTVAPNAEITLEANPDDLADAKLRLLAQYVNRLSIGIQTFDEATLRWMNRAHTAIEAETCVQRAREVGFEQLSIDLIYGHSAQVWPADLDRALALKVPHLSAYALTIEPDTAFGRWTKQGKLQPADEELAAQQFEELRTALLGERYEHYEISNFAKLGPNGIGQYARHNTAYWQQRPYLGVGPSAHSYDGSSRQYNVANNTLYRKAIERGEIPAEREVLTRADRVNEYLLTGLRTQWGCQITELNTLLGQDFVQQASREVARLKQAGWLQQDNGVLYLTDAGKLFADRVTAELFIG